MGERTAGKLDRIARELDSIAERAREFEALYSDQLRSMHPWQMEAGQNLLHYLALRQSDVRDLQNDLASMGLSSLGSSEAHVLSSVYAVRHAVRSLLGESARLPRVSLTRRRGRARLHRNTNELFGRKRSGSSIRIMVTMPSEAADDPRIVLDMLKAGMNCARINCSAGSPDEWARIVAHIRRARSITGRACAISMDLCGPKIRTGSLVPSPEVVHIKPDTDPWGRVSDAAVVALTPEGALEAPTAKKALPVSPAAFAALRSGCSVDFLDARGSTGSIEIDETRDGVARGRCWSEVYVQSGTPISVQGPDSIPTVTGSFGRLTGKRPGIRLEIGDVLAIHADPRPGERAKPADADGPGTPAHVSCAVPEVLSRVKVGDEVVLDDGKFRGVTREVRPGEVTVVITHAAPGGAKLREGKGINLPDSNVGLFGLTEKDREDLSFVVPNADIVNVSFVNRPEDVEEILDALNAAGGHHLGLILKIETLMGVRQLPGILLAAMEWPKVGVMIARGDLAVDVGWTRLGRVQEEILWLCEAAHVPVVWATEVLNQLAKKGMPTRGEISDVVSAERAECVMLNKGPHVTTAIRTLDTILRSMEEYQFKKTVRLPVLPLERPDPTGVRRPRDGRPLAHSS